MAKKTNKYPPYPGSGRDYAVVETARQALRKPNKNICIYCHAQAVTEDAIQHAADCPHGRHLAAIAKVPAEAIATEDKDRGYFVDVVVRVSMVAPTRQTAKDR